MTSDIAALPIINVTPAKPQAADNATGNAVAAVLSDNPVTSAPHQPPGSQDASAAPAQASASGNQGDKTPDFNSLLQPTGSSVSSSAPPAAANGKGGAADGSQENNPPVPSVAPSVALGDFSGVSSLVVLVQAQFSSAVNSPSDADAASAQDLLQQLQQILHTLLQLAQSAGQGATGTSPADSASVPPPQRKTDNGQGDASSSSMPSDPLSQALAQLLALLMQLQQLQQPAPVQSSSQFSFESLTVEQVSTNAAPQNAGALLAQLASAIQSGLSLAPAAASAVNADGTQTLPDDASGTVAAGVTADNPGSKADAAAPSDSTQSGADAVQPGMSAPSNPFLALVQLVATDAGKAMKAAKASQPNAAVSSAVNDNADPANISSRQMDTLKSLFSIISQMMPQNQQDKGQGSKQDTGNGADGGQTANLNGAFMQVNTPFTPPVAGSEVKITSASQAGQNVTDQVLVQIKNTAAVGTSQIKIQLQPENLGKVEVQMVTGTDGKTGITITADNRQTLALLQNEAHALESALRDIGLKTDAGGLNFNLRGEQHNSGQHGHYTKAVGISSEDEADFGTINASYQLTVQQGLDIRV